VPDLAVARGFDAYGHPTEAWTQNVAGFTTSTSGTTAGTLVNPGGQDPTGTTTIAPPYCISDAYGQFQVTPKGTQTTTGNLRTVYFQKNYPMVRPVLCVMSLATSAAAAGGTLTLTMTTTAFTMKVGTKLTSSGAVTNIGYSIF